MFSHRTLIRHSLPVILTAVFSAPVVGQTQPPATSPMPPEIDRFNITPFMAGSFGGDLQSAPATFGAALGYGANERITLEGEFAVAPNALQGQLIEFDTNYWTLTGNVLYHFTRERFTPYAVVGLGVINSNPDTPSFGVDVAETDGSGLVWNFGGGAKAALNNRLGLRADLRYMNASNAAPDHWRLYGGLVFRRIGSF
jgi:hypothetical protein